MPDDEETGGQRTCDRCGTKAAVYQMRDLNLCRRCFRELAPKMGFEKHE